MAGAVFIPLHILPLSVRDYMAGSINYKNNSIWINNYMRSTFYEIILIMCKKDLAEVYNKIHLDEELQMLADCGGMFIPMESVLKYFSSIEEYINMVNDNMGTIDHFKTSSDWKEYLKKLFRCVNRMLADDAIDWSDSPNLTDIKE